MTAEIREFAHKRWSILHAILADPRMSSGAKNVAASLLTRFANAKSGRCRVRHSDVAQAVAMKQDSVYRCLCQLAEAGYLIEIERGRATGLYSFVAVQTPAENVHHIGAEVGCTSEFSSEIAAEKPDVYPEIPDEHPRNPDVYPEPPTPPYKDTPNSSKSSKTGFASAPVRPGFRVEAGSGAEEGWNEWLSNRCYPPLAQLARPWPDDPSAYDLPIAYPPGELCPKWRHDMVQRYLDECIARRQVFARLRA